jgi:hypothetical protein
VQNEEQVASCEDIEIHLEFPGVRALKEARNAKPSAIQNGVSGVSDLSNRCTNITKPSLHPLSRPYPECIAFVSALLALCKVDSHTS